MGNIVYDKSFAYAVEIIRISKMLRQRGEFELAKQLLRCSTSIGANLSESEYAQSDSDFISKLSIALKEASESRYWLRLLTASAEITTDVSSKLISQADEIIKILTASLKTLKDKQKQ